MSLFTVIPQGPFESNGRKELSLSSCGWVLIRSGQFKITVSFCTVKLRFLYSTVSMLKSIFGMVVTTSPSFSSYCSSWTSASVLGCSGTGWLQLSSVMCFSSYFALSRSQSFGSLCLPLAMLFQILFHHCSRSSIFFSRGPRALVAFSLLFTTGSLAVVPSLFFFLLASPPPALLWGSLLFRGSPTPLLGIGSR